MKMGQKGGNLIEGKEGKYDPVVVGWAAVWWPTNGVADSIPRGVVYFDCTHS